MRRADGSIATVVSVRSGPGAAAMWDLTVSQVHTFAVGSDAYVVHNCGKVDYGSTDLSKAVQDRRMHLHDNTGNYGAATLDDGSTSSVGRKADIIMPKMIYSTKPTPEAVALSTCIRSANRADDVQGASRVQG